MPKNFFDESKEQSRVKAEIVSKYFWAWAKAILSDKNKPKTEKIAYIDLFSGPGRYKDGTLSTPLLILEKAIRDESIRNALITLFNDADKNSSQSLQRAIYSISDINLLKYPPEVRNKIVGKEIVEQFEQRKLIPTLFFIDPWGYKGLSLRLINSVLKDWGCDCIFFFNFNRINMGIHNPKVENHIQALFSDPDTLRKRLKTSRQLFERESIILEELKESLKGMGGEYFLSFRFRRDNKRISHHLIFVTKSIHGYKIMKEVMANESSLHEQDVASFEYIPEIFKDQQRLFTGYPIDKLKNSLLEKFSGRSMKMIDVCTEHYIGTPYIKSNYKAALKALEQESKIIVESSGKRRKGTFSDSLIVIFPK